MNTKLLRQKVLDLAIHGKLLDKAVVEALETTPGYEPASKLLERIRGESDVLFSDISKSETKLVSEATLPLASRVFERNSVVSDSERTTPSPRGKAPKTPSAPISEDEIPFEIPENWCWCRLKDIVDISSAKRVLKEDWKSEGIPFFRAREIAQLANGEKPIDDLFITNEMYQSLKQNYGIPKPGDLMVSAVGTIGKIYIVREEDCFYYKDASVIKFSPLLKDINSSWLKKTIESPFLQTQIYAHSNGTTVDTITISTASEYMIPLPPLEEQKLIVEEIERVFALIDTVEQNKTDLETVIKQTKSKILDLAIHGKLVPQDKADEPASKMLEKLRAEKEEKIANGQLKRDKNDSYIYKSADGKWLERKADGSEEEIEVPFEIPESWSWCKIKEIANIARGGSPRPIEDFITEDENGVNWIKIGDTKEGDKYITSVREKIKPEGIKHSRFVHSGDFLLTNSMSFGRPYILKVNGCIHDGWLVFADIGKIIDSDFLYYSLSSDFIYTAFSFVAAGSTVKNLKSDTVKETIFPLPPLEEQKRIVSMIENTIKSLEIVNYHLKGN
ncbi:MAG: restriction endonuclease subunit S [Treponema sp.]|nr:restriction endonuclease subunit S [Treponema sp.]